MSESTAFYKRAIERLREIRQQRAALEVEQEEIISAMRVMARFGAPPPTEQPTTSDEAALRIEEAYRNADPGFPMSQAEFEVLAEKALNQAGRPMTRTQILQWLSDNGTPLHGTDASKNAGTKLWRAREKFINLRGSGYWFRERACPIIGYIPTILGSIVSPHEREDDVPPDENEAA